MLERGSMAAMLTGIPLYRLVASWSEGPLSIYSEDGIADADWPFLAAALAAGAEVRFAPDGVSLNSPVPLNLSVEAKRGLLPRLDGRPWWGVGGGEILLPPGKHRLSLSANAGKDTEQEAASPRVVAATCAFGDFTLTPRTLRFVYESKERAAFLLSQEPADVRIVDEKGEAGPSPVRDGAAILAPPGRHAVTVVTESWSSFAVRAGSLALSGGIVALAGLALAVVIILFVCTHLGHRVGARPPPR
jgi:hypothetical protein